MEIKEKLKNYTESTTANSFKMKQKPELRRGSIYDTNWEQATMTKIWKVAQLLAFQ